MQGLLNRARQPQPAGGGGQQPAQQPAPQGAPQSPGQQGQEKQLNNQEAYDLATGQMLSFVYDDEGAEILQSSMQSLGDPQQAMARLLGRLLVMTVQSAMMSGKRIAPDLIFQGAIEVIRAISEVAQAQGLLDKSEEKQVAEAAFYDGLALFANEAQEEALTEEERQRYVQLLDMAEQIEQGGGMAGREPAQQPGAQPNQREAQA